MTACTILLTALFTTADTVPAPVWPAAKAECPLGGVCLGGCKCASGCPCAAKGTPGELTLYVGEARPVPDGQQNGILFAMKVYAPAYPPHSYVNGVLAMNSNYHMPMPGLYRLVPADGPEKASSGAASAPAAVTGPTLTFPQGSPYGAVYGVPQGYGVYGRPVFYPQSFGGFQGGCPGSNCPRR